MNRPDLYLQALDIVSGNERFQEVTEELTMEEILQLEEYIEQIEQNQKDDDTE